MHTSKNHLKDADACRLVASPADLCGMLTPFSALRASMGRLRSGAKGVVQASVVFFPSPFPAPGRARRAVSAVDGRAHREMGSCFGRSPKISRLGLQIHDLPIPAVVLSFLCFGENGAAVVCLCYQSGREWGSLGRNRSPPGKTEHPGAWTELPVDWTENPGDRTEHPVDWKRLNHVRYRALNGQLGELSHQVGFAE